MRLGISSYTYAWAIGVPEHPPARPLTATGLLDRAAGLGVHLVQVADNLPLDRLSAPQLEAFEQHATDLRVSLEVGTRGIHPDHLRTYLRLAERLRSPILRVVVDTADHHPAEDEVVETIQGLLPEFERAGVCLAIENHDRFPAKTLARIIQRMDSPYVGICLDTVNSFGAVEGPAVVVEVLGPWVVNLHVKDFVVQRASHKMGFTVEGRPAGRGQLNVPWLLQALRDQIQGRRGFTSVRVEPNAILELWTPPEQALADTMAKEEAWAAASIAYLRQFVPG